MFCLSVFSQENSCKLRVEGVSLQSEYINRCDPSFVSELVKKHLGFIISVDNLPEDESEFFLLIERPLFANGFLGFSSEQANRIVKVSRDQLLLQQKGLSYPFPVITSFSSAGYAPGERVEIHLLNHNQHELSKVAFIPSPLRKRSKDGVAKILFECISLESSWYKASFTGFEENEVVMFESESGSEKILPQKLNINKSLMFNYSNAVVGMNGGVSRFTVIRDNGEKLVFKLPWGIKLMPYFKGYVAHGDKI